MQNKKEDFWLEPGGPKRLMVEYEPRFKHADVTFDGQKRSHLQAQEEFNSRHDGQIARWIDADGEVWADRRSGMAASAQGHPFDSQRRAGAGFGCGAVAEVDVGICCRLAESFVFWWSNSGLIGFGGTSRALCRLLGILA